MIRSLAPLIVLLVLVLVGYAYFRDSHRALPADTSATSTPYVVPALTQQYENAAYGFSLYMPEDFASSETTDDDGRDVITLQNKSGEGIEVTISPFDEDTGDGYTLTKERVLQDVPDLAIADEQPVEIGTHDEGLAFKSDNPAFGGASRDVWFVFRGHLYQISTYARLDDLLKAIFGTWTFTSPM